MDTFDWIVALAGLVIMGGYGWLLARGSIPLRDEQGRVRPIVVIGALGMALVLAGLVMNVTQ